MMLWENSVTENRVDCSIVITENRVDCSIVMVILRADSYDAMGE